MIMFLISSTGHGWREIEDEWDFPRLERWLAYCEKHPPLQMMVQAYLGCNPKDDGPMRVTEENFDQFIAMLGPGRVLNG
jgi:hypothetical protein